MSDYLKPFLAIALPFLGAAPARIVTRKEIETWYKVIKKPSWRPPNWVFGPMWTSLYISMGYASYLIWKEGGGFNDTTKLPLMLYGSNLALNWAWSFIFFGAHKIGWGAVEIVIVWANVAACVLTFQPVSVNASRLMMPYLAWMTLASALNIRIWQLNKDRPSMSE